jgi:squalene-hopene/tetraprenyl-beta-curcumene cyclase
LRQLGEPDPTTVRAAEAGVNWLLNLQNRDGGMPTFCRGWGTLPFDRSTPELTAHALRAWIAWRPLCNPRLAHRVEAALPRVLAFLERSQREDGAWIPLWFGNEHANAHENPVYGTAQVLIALNEVGGAGVRFDEKLHQRAGAFLMRSQNGDGGWGGDQGAPTTIEETALAVEALSGSPEQAAVERGRRCLLELVESGGWRSPAPIGLYFARLWYYERLYPLIFATSALGKVASKLR